MSRRLRHLRSVCVLLAALAAFVPAAFATPAVAQDDEVFIDPDSPTGREYEIPLERARRDASSATPSGDYRARTAPLFGEGIDPAAGSERGDDPARSTGGRKGGNRSATEPQVRRGRPPALQAAIEQPAAPHGGSGTLLLVITVGGLGVALGAIVGLVLRRRGES
jgi:hypothetical protein